MANEGPLKVLFNNANKKDEEVDFMDIDTSPGKQTGAKNTKRLSVERIYQKKTQLQHILLRPDTYIGSTEMTTTPMWVYDEETEAMIQREISFVPGLYKIFDEILVNAADNKQRDPKMNCIRIDIDPESNKIKIWNNGKGIPVVEHKKEKMFVPSLIFGHLLTSSNFNDEDKKVTGGRNGYGAKLCNIFSSKFIVETSCKEYSKSFKQTWQGNMSKTAEAKLSDAKSEDYTSVTFYPDLTKFKMEKLDKDIVDLFTRRAYDIAAVSKGVKVFLNGKKLPIKDFKDYVNLFIKNKYDESDQPLKVTYDCVNPRWEVAVAMSDSGFKQASFVNSIATTKGGRHVDYITDQVVTKLLETVKKKSGKGSFNIKPFQVKTHLWIFVNCLIENPTFDSQTKEFMTLTVKNFGSKCQLSDKFVNQVNKCGIIESIMSWMTFKAKAQLNKKSGSKQSKLRGIPKLDDANEAGTKNSSNCTLILTEGDSAKTLAVAGLGIIGRDHYGVFPLRGKVLNVREATHKQVMENAEITNIVKIVGLQYKKKYDDAESLKTLRYGKIMIMTDQDQDGSHIKGLLINFIHHNWPSLLKQNFLVQFITPIVKVTKNKVEKSFYSLPEFEEWKTQTENWHTWRCKYYKGLGTSTAKEAKEYFSDMGRHKILFRYRGTEDDDAITLAFSKKKIDDRKEWLTNWMEERKRRAEIGLPEVYLYGKNTTIVTYNEFINKELVLFSNADNERSIPSAVDGFKPGQRKVMFTCFKRNLVKELKVVQLAGSVAEMSAYHHGETSLMGTIVGLAQNFVGSNNINLLQPIGQFGTRLHGGKDSASPRYIFTALSTLTRILFNVNDDPLLNFLKDDNQNIEPDYYVPIIPTVLCNGAEGIGTGWSTKVPNYDPREVITNLKRMMRGEDPLPMLPWFKNFKGTIEQIEAHKYVVNGEVSIIDDTTIEITELPLRTWTQTYKEQTLEPMLHGTEKIPPLITDYKEYHTDTTVKFVIKMASEKLATAEEEGLHKVFKLQTSISTQSMVLFDKMGVLRRYNSETEIIKEFYDHRMEMYVKRKDYLKGILTAESLKLDNQARFIMEKIEGKITIENKPKKELISMLLKRGYDSDPVKAWKLSQNKGKDDEQDNDDDSQSEMSQGSGSGPDFNYILNMALWCLSKEKKEELLKQRDKKAEELVILKGKKPSDLWIEDLTQFVTELDKVEAEEKEDEQGVVHKKVAQVKGSRPKKLKAVADTLPSPSGRRVVPSVDAIRARAEKDAKAKVKKEEKKGKQLESFGFGDDDSPSETKSESKTSDKPKTLAEKLGANFKDKGGKSKKQTTLVFKTKDEIKVETKKAKGKNPWDSDSEDSPSDLDSDEPDNKKVSPRIVSKRVAAAKVTYKISDDESSSRKPSDDEDSEDDFKPSILDMTGDDEPNDSEIVPPKRNVKAAIIELDDQEGSDDDKDDDDDQEGSDDDIVDLSQDDDNSEDAKPTESHKPGPAFSKKQKPAAKKRTLGKLPTATAGKAMTQPNLFASMKVKPSEKASTSSKTANENKKPRKKPEKKVAVTKKRTLKMFKDSDDSTSSSEEEFVPKKKSTAVSKKKKFNDSDDDVSDLESDISPKKGRTARQNVKKTYKFSDSGDDDDY